MYTVPNCLLHIVCPSTFLIFFDNKAFVYINFIWIILKLANSGLNMHIFDISNFAWIVTEFPDFSTVIYCIGQKFACLFLKLFRIFRSSLEWNFSTTIILNKNISGLIKIIIDKSCGGKFLWNRNWDSGRVHQSLIWAASALYCQMTVSCVW